MNKFILIAVFFTPLFGVAQVTFSSWSSSFMQINSYNGNSSSDAFNLKVEGNGNFNIPNWKISVKLKQNIVSKDGKYTIPANKIFFQPISTTGQSYPNPIPTFPQIGAPINVFLQDSGEAFLIPNSNAPLSNRPATENAYYNLQLKFGMTLMGGSYLGSFPAWTEFILPVEFNLYNQNNVKIGTASNAFQIQIGSITDSPPVNEFTLKVNTNAANGLLEFKTMQDYTNGTSVTYAKGLSVSSNTSFQIKVRSQENNLRSDSGNSIPVDVIRLTLATNYNNNQSISPIVLSSYNQTLVQANTATRTDYSYDIKYSTQPQDTRLNNAKPDNYKTTLQYEITPQ